FFADPKGWARAFKPRLVAALTASGKARAAAGRTAAALELWGRALGHEPRNEELRALVDGVAAHQRRSHLLRRGVVVAGALVVVAAAGLGAQRWLKQHHAMTTPSPAHVAPPTTRAPLVPLSEPHSDFKATLKSGDKAKAPTIVAAPAAKRHPAHDKPTVAADTAPPRTFELAPTPKAVAVFLDGKRLGDYGPQLSQLPVSSGRHTVRFESPYCFPADVDIADNEPPGRIAARLRWKPARLTVKADPDSADVLVDGTILRSGQQTDVNIPQMSDGKKSVTVRVSAAGYASQTLAVELRANDQRVQTVTLQKRGAE
ncbi:MAG TPA: hypothetical protein VF997_09320, partial [Polyangia bacterium]